MADTHFDAIVVGSGFGGSVMAYRLAEAGLRVCVLERGAAFPPGSFPRTPYEMGRNFWDPSEGKFGMFDIWTFRGKRWSLKGIDVVVSSGLGGGSLTYANVLLRKDERWFVQEDLEHGGYEYWPVTREELDPHYCAVEKMIGVQCFPFEHPDYACVTKTGEFKRAGERLGYKWELVPLAVTFANQEESPKQGVPIADPLPNLHGRTRYTCRLCGECDIGCNYGSKNTLDYNYLSRAEDLGAEIRTLTEVRSFAPEQFGNRQGYSVTFVKHNPELAGEQNVDTRNLQEHRLTADQLVLSAGTLGTTYLLLKNETSFPGLSKQLGNRFSGNGDLLTFVTGARTRTNDRQDPVVLEPSRGPVITSAIRVKDELDGGEGRGYYIEDAGYPEFLSWIVAMSLPSFYVRLARMVGRKFWRTVRNSPVSNLSGEIAWTLGDGATAAGSLPLLGMGRDLPDGKLFLNGRYLNSDWNTKGSSEYFDRIRSSMKDIADELNGRFFDNPIWGLSRVITVHPLGGCPMARNEKEGVVDSYGRVFGYPGFYIADGSVMPGPVGPNPSLTIAALADRFADKVIAESRIGDG